ncbi:LacI family DNA-binding transcriptional regulator [Streptomyces sp. NBC_00448]|uniref:LacI family DNA-binding transcriptional regulator n=1 Tax=Streptomyces sp. NBC_00448 TaxID=2903652 RepID=UPI002E23CB58
MLTEERREAILRVVERRGSVTVKDLSEEMGVSTVTVRQDVRELAGKGLLARVHGGAMSPAAARAHAPKTSGGPRPAAPPGRSVGLVVPPGGYYYAEVISGVQDAARALEVRVVLAVSGETLPENQEQVRQLLAAGAEGLLLMPHPGLGLPEEVETWLGGLDVPAVLMERRARPPAGATEQVASHHAYGAQLAVRHLAGLGHDRVALVARIESPNTPLIQEGYAAAVAELGLVTGLEYPVTTTEGGDAVAGRFEAVVRAAAAGGFRAALVHNDIDAIALVGLLRARGLRVPEDVAVVAYDDEVAELADTPLTAVAPPKHAVGAWALDLLIRRLEDPSRPVADVLLRPVLNVRASSGPTVGDQ